MVWSSTDPSFSRRFICFKLAEANTSAPLSPPTAPPSIFCLREPELANNNFTLHPVSFSNSFPISLNASVNDAAA